MAFYVPLNKYSQIIVITVTYYYCHIVCDFIAIKRFPPNVKRIVVVKKINVRPVTKITTTALFKKKKKPSFYCGRRISHYIFRK